MATAVLTHQAPSAADATTPAPSPSPLTAALTTAAICIAVVWVAVTALLLTLTETNTLGAIGVGGFAAFWLGGGFGAIFGSAAAFGRHH